MTEQPPSQEPSAQTGADAPAEPATQVQPAPGASAEAPAPVPPPEPGEPVAVPPAPPAATPAFGTTAPGPETYEAPSPGGGLSDRVSALFGPEHPERAVGGAFAGGLVLALILKRLAR